MHVWTVLTRLSLLAVLVTLMCGCASTPGQAHVTQAVSCIERGDACYNRGQYEQAITEYTEGIRLWPGIACSYHNRGVAYGALGDHDRAIADFAKALELEPADAQRRVCLAAAHYNRGLEREEAGQHDAAISDYTEAIALAPTLTQAYVNRGRAHSNLGDSHQARLDWERAIALDPNGHSGQIARQNLAGLEPAAPQSTQGRQRGNLTEFPVRAWVTGSPGPNPQLHWERIANAPTSFMLVFWQPATVNKEPEGRVHFAIMPAAPPMQLDILELPPGTYWASMREAGNLERQVSNGVQFTVE